MEYAAYLFKVECHDKFLPFTTVGAHVIGTHTEKPSLILNTKLEKHEKLIWSVSVNACIISDQLGLQPIFGATGLVY